MASSSLVFRQVPSRNDWLWQIVDVCERVSAAGLLAALSPLMAGCAAATSLISGQTPLIAHRRVGWRGDTLWMLKLRTMWGGEEPPSREGSRWVEYIDDESGPDRKGPGDPRVSNRFARFCRQHSIDEIPQLWHVVRGEMSLVGPRPMTAAEIRRHYADDAEELLRVKPGMAGLWQVSGRNLLSYRERRQLDLDFVRGRSIGMYLRILMRTVGEVWRGAGAW